MSSVRRFEVHELRGADDAAPEAELAQALRAARAMEAAMAGSEARPSPDLADRIMATLAREPAARAVGILGALRGQPGPAGFAESLRIAWERVVGGSRPAGVRALALAYVSFVLVLTVSLSGFVAYGAAGALGGLLAQSPSLDTDATQGLETPGPLLSPPEESLEPDPSQSAAPSESPEPSESPDATAPEPSGQPGDDGAAGAAPTADHATPQPSDDHGGDNGPSPTPEPTRTLQPGETPRPSATPSDDSSPGD